MRKRLVYVKIGTLSTERAELDRDPVVGERLRFRRLAPGAPWEDGRVWRDPIDLRPAGAVLPGADARLHFLELF